jgi:hypothetical protein
MGDRYFTLDEVNALVPVLTMRMNYVLQLHGHLRSTCRSLVLQGVRVTPESLARGERIEAEGKAKLRVAHARGIHDAVRDAMASIEAMGGVIKDVEQGLVDFPSWLEGRKEVLLCWKIGESRVDWYHDSEAGFSGRQPVAGCRFMTRKLD